MIFWFIFALVDIQHKSCAATNFANVLISSPNTSSFYRFLSAKPSSPHPTCPLSGEHLYKGPLKLDSCDLLLKNDVIKESLSDLVAESGLKKNNASSVAMEQGNNMKRKAQTQSASMALESQSITKNSEQAPMVTFDEWTKEKLKLEGLKKNNQHRSSDNIVSLSNGAQDSPSASTAGENNGNFMAQKVSGSLVVAQGSTLRNYASKECGAKVLFSNEEAENRNAVLNEKEADDYMRNPCERAQHKWIIFELCETIQPTRLEIANFELFSSSPRDVRILGSERYPSNDWILLGELLADDTRSIQSFPLTANRVYIKFIRLELLTHYGREHYCTLSLVRVFGVSIVDEYEAEAEAAAAAVPIPVSEPLQAVPVSSSPLLASSLLVARESIGEEKSSKHLSTNDMSQEQAQEKEQSFIANNENVVVKQKDRHIVDTVVDVMGNIGIANIKNVIESAFLRSWKTKSGCSKWSNNSLEWMCKSCPVPGFRKVGFLFCHAFFHLGRKPYKKQKTVVAKSVVAEPASPAPSFDLFSLEVKEKRISMVRKSSITESQTNFLSKIVDNMCSFDMSLAPNFENMDSLLNDNTLGGPNVTSKPVNIVPLAKLNVAQALPGGTVSHKESVFLKLNKRISALELNMSLSSEYLSELSRRYVEKVSESHKQTERIVKMAEDAAANAVREVKSDLESKIMKLSKELKEVEKLVKALAGDVFFSHTALGKSMALENQRVPVNTYEAPPFTLDKGRHILSAQQHLLYSNDHLWTTEQLIFMVVLAQASTVIMMVLIQHCYNKKWFAEVHRLRKIINEQIFKMVADDNNLTVGRQIGVCSMKKSKRKKRRQKQLMQHNNPSEVGSSASSSLLQHSSKDLSETEVPDSIQNLKTLSKSEESWEEFKQTCEKSWNPLLYKYPQNSKRNFLKSESEEELNLASAKDREARGRSSEELQLTSLAKEQLQNELPRLASLVNPCWQVVKRKRKKFDRSPFKQVL